MGKDLPPRLASLLASQPAAEKSSGRGILERVDEHPGVGGRGRTTATACWVLKDGEAFFRPSEMPGPRQNLNNRPFKTPASTHFRGSSRRTDDDGYGIWAAQ